ncbi:uncharacterized protein LY89DRAFT_717382 [Mollisia scopiformis]|uniref:Uncharacterized protein n=1 Tax=Mollisia scopiformis TaxID=149040 RepID=A0A194XGG1_MOLSC|nr:uncharacterized protein LY89DRAFT_717382 [Mollisia scopiformis]KUJ18862.1 hypothetical protein LY89DRAFT_717382 [Mollisia scopiformis]
MATSQSGQPDESPYPSYKELRRNQLSVNSTDAVNCLFWHFDGVFPAAISVMTTPRTPNSLKPYFQPEAGGSGSGTWHQIARLPITEPKVSSIEISVSDLESWRNSWLEQHKEHPEGEYVTYGDLSDDERPYPSEEGGWESDSDTPYLVRCCGEDRPPNETAKLVVTPSAGNHFVTVQDYVSTVHPWLMSLREDILQAKKVVNYYPQPMPTDFMVIGMVPDNIRIEDKQYWIEGFRPGGRLPRNAHEASIIDRLRRPR